MSAGQHARSGASQKEPVAHWAIVWQVSKHAPSSHAYGVQVVVFGAQLPAPSQLGWLRTSPVQLRAPQATPAPGKTQAPVWPSQSVAPHGASKPAQAALQQCPVPSTPQTPEAHWSFEEQGPTPMSEAPVPVPVAVAPAPPPEPPVAPAVPDDAPVLDPDASMMPVVTDRRQPDVTMITTAAIANTRTPTPAST